MNDLSRMARFTIVDNPRDRAWPFERKPIRDADYLDGIALIRERWTRIRDEALALHRAGELDATTRLASMTRGQRGLRALCRRGWEKFVVTWQGASHRCARRLCPETVGLLAQVPGIRAAMLCVLPADTELSLPPDPFARTLRYHLGLATPDSDRCFISVDGTRLRWRNGEDFVFDEALPYVAKNGTDELLLILICEVDRPAGLLRRTLREFGTALRRRVQVDRST
jgi:beta-hydroxylase